MRFLQNLSKLLLKTTLAAAAFLPALSVQAETPLPEIWGNVWYMTSWRGTGGANNGYYTFTPKAPLSFTNVGKNEDLYASGGYEFRDGRLHMIMANYYREDDGSLTATPHYYCIDTKNWKTIESKAVKVPGLVAQETAYHAATKKTWGVFYSDDYKRSELGVIDYLSMTRSTIATLDHEYVALGITKAGILYGVASDSYLYKIDPETGVETAIGDTGVSLTDNFWHTFNRQTGEIDQRTDTFYWACIDSNSNSYLYTVSLNTGKTTLVGEFPEKASITAMYIPQPEAEEVAPDCVQSLTATAAPKGKLEATLSFTMPSKTVEGNDIEGTMNVEIMRGAYEVAAPELADLTPGQKVTWTDTGVPEDFAWEYTVRAVSGNLKGEPAKVKVFVGKDVPCKPTNVRLCDMGNNLLQLRWDKASEVGVNGGYVDPEETQYVVCNIEKRDGIDTPIIRETVDGLSYDITDMDLDAGESRLIYYGLAAQNAQGRSKVASSEGLVAGKCETLPFKENFAVTPTYFWWTTRNGNAQWKILRFEGYDDYGYASFLGMSLNDEGWLCSNKISTGGKSAKLSFAYGATPGENIRLHVYAVDPENKPYELEDIRFSELSGEPTWRLCEVDIPDELTSKAYMILKFHAVYNASANQELFLDSVAVTATSGITDAIEEVPTGEKVIYNLQGIRVPESSAKNGIYIVNGKKMRLK